MLTKFKATLTALLCAPVLASCSTGYFDHLAKGPAFVETPDPSASEEQTPNPEPQATYDQGLPLEERPVHPPRDAWDECPYLDTNWVAETNGQRVLAVGVDGRFDTPACVFWSYDDQPQLQVIVRHMGSEEEATEVVDHFAPVEWTSPANKPDGWNGGRGTWDAGSVYSVFNNDMAVVVLSNQQQTIKPATIAEEVIENLSL